MFFKKLVHNLEALKVNSTKSKLIQRNWQYLIIIWPQMEIFRLHEILKIVYDVWLFMFWPEKGWEEQRGVAETDQEVAEGKDWEEFWSDGKSL